MIDVGDEVAADLDARIVEPVVRITHSFEKSGDVFTISVGAERYAFPEALVMGG